MDILIINFNINYTYPLATICFFFLLNWRRSTSQKRFQFENGKSVLFLWKFVATNGYILSSLNHSRKISMLISALSLLKFEWNEFRIFKFTNEFAEFTKILFNVARYYFIGEYLITDLCLYNVLLSSGHYVFALHKNVILIRIKSMKNEMIHFKMGKMFTGFSTFNTERVIISFRTNFSFENLK